MPTFPFFPNRRRDIKKLVEQARNQFDPESKQHFAVQVGLVFDPLLEPLLSRTEQANEALRMMLIFELCGLICTLPKEDDYFVHHYKTVLAELVKACRWKQLLGNDSLIETIQSDTSRQLDIRYCLSQIRERPKVTYTQRLALMLTEQDQQAVAVRTLRTLARTCSHQPATTKNLFWLHKGRVQIRTSFFHEYLLEQVAFRVYMFHTPAEASFIEESVNKMRHWVTAQIVGRSESTGPELTEAINDLVSQVKEDFIRKCHQKQRDPENFYLDCTLTTFLISFVKRNHAIDLLLKLQLDHEHTTVIEKLSTEDGETSPDADKLEDTIYPVDSLDDSEEQMDLLRRCLKTLEAKCQEVIGRHHDNNFGMPVPFQTLAKELQQPAKVLEGQYRRCLEHLKKITLAAYKRQQLILYPR